MKFSKSFLPFLLIVLLFSCKKQKENSFELNVKVQGDYSGYLYLNYGKIKDSCLIEKGMAIFTGKADFPIRANFGTDKTYASDKNIYLENRKIEALIHITEKNIRNYDLYWIDVISISGNKTSEIITDFENYKKLNSVKSDWNLNLFNKIEKIIKENPKNSYSGDLLDDVANDTILNIEQIKQLYSYLDLKSQDSSILRNLKEKIFPEHKLKVGDKIIDFELENRSNKLISTKKYRNEVIFIDFWASWCEPCRNQFKELRKIHSDYENLKILGVSLDENKTSWLMAVDKEQVQWENVIDTTSFNGVISEKYGIRSIPYNILVNKNGEIIALDLDVKELRNYLNSVYK